MIFNFLVVSESSILSMARVFHEMCNDNFLLLFPVLCAKNSTVSYADVLSMYVYALSPIFWIDPFGLARVKNAVEGERRYQLLNEQLRAKHPEATIQCECYLRDANGKSVRDPVTGERRRVDTVVIEGGRGETYEATSLASRSIE